MGIVAVGGRTELVLDGVTKNLSQWGGSGFVLTPTQTDPFGGTQAFLLREDATNGNHLIQGAVASLSIAAGKLATVSVLVKNNSGARWVWLDFVTAGVVDSFAYFNPSTGSIGANTNSSGDVQYTVTPLANGWFLFTMTYTTAPATAVTGVTIGLADVDGGLSYQGDNVSSVFLYAVNVTDFDVDMVEAATLGSTARRVLSLLRGSHVTETQMPANTGDMVVFVADAVTVPTAAPVGGEIIYGEGGQLKCRTAIMVTTLAG